MKNNLTILFFASILFCYTDSYSQKSSFTCDDSRFKQEYSENQQFNTLIDSACVEINSEHFEEGYKLLTQAVEMHSVDPNISSAYINQQWDLLGKYLHNKKSGKPVATKQPKTNQSAKSKKASKPTTEKKEEQPDVAENKGIAENTSAPVEDKVAVEQTTTTMPTEQPEVKTTTDLHENKTSNQKEEPKHDDAFADKKEEASAEQPTATVEKTFSEEELNEFHLKGEQKVKDLESFIKQIADKNTPGEISDQTIENAVKLFESEDKNVEISTINKPNKKRVKVRKYLENLRMLPYENIQIEWAEFQYTSDFHKGPDGNYYGYITFRQRFTATTSDKVAYTDITTKKAEVILKFYNKAVEGVQTENWDIFLGDISVVQTEKN